MKRFPATLDGLASAVAWKRLNGEKEIFLSGKVDEVFRYFPQYKDFQIIENLKGESNPTFCVTSNLVLEIENKGLDVSAEDLELFVSAIYFKTNGLMDPSSRPEDAKALAFCMGKGIKIADALSKIKRLGLYAIDLMTKPVKTVKLTEKAVNVKNIMDRSGLTGLPVVGDNGQIAGMVTKKDIDRAIKSGIEDLSMIMSIPAIAVKSDEPIDRIWALMAIHDIGRIVVIDGNNFPIGIITRRDLMRAIADSTKVYEVTSNILKTMEKIIPQKLLGILKELGEFAISKTQRIYAVGGFVRDLLMGKNSLDVDIVVEGNGIELAQEFAKAKDVRCIIYPDFGTAKIHVNGISIDIATARTEYYETPGSLPKVESSNLRKDLYRRDFTINAMAIDLTPEKFGTLIDFFGGRNDIKNKEIRILHNLSFVEDPTRILRAIRYKARFGYRLSHQTEILLLSALKQGYLFSVSSKRIRTELERSIEDEKVKEIFNEFQKYGVIETLYCDAKIDFERFFNLSKTIDGKKINVLYAIFLVIFRNCPQKKASDIMKAYGMPKKVFDILLKIQDDTFLKQVRDPENLSGLYRTLSKLSSEALVVLAYDQAYESNVLKYVKVLSQIRLEKVNGLILKKKYGLKGLEIKKVLDRVLDMKIDSGSDELEALNKIMGDNN